MYEKRARFCNTPVNIWFKLFFCIGLCLCASGCATTLWTSGNLIYDRHSVYQQFNDFKLAAEANRVLFHDKRFKCSDCAIELAVINRDVLMVGHVPSLTLRNEANARIASIPGKRNFYNQLDVSRLSTNHVLDSWITTKIRSQIFADADIDPRAFKIITSNQIVYLMGNVIPEQAEKVILMARSCQDVKRVVKLFKYYNLSSKPDLKKLNNNI